jgi:hypothetical protein
MVGAITSHVQLENCMELEPTIAIAFRLTPLLKPPEAETSKS